MKKSNSISLAGALLLILVGCILAIYLLGEDIIFVVAIVLILLGGVLFLTVYYHQIKERQKKVIAEIEQAMKEVEEDFFNKKIDETEFRQKYEILEIQKEVEERRFKKSG